MVLSRQKILERLKTPLRTTAIQEARNHEDKVKFHAKTVDEKHHAPYYDRFIKWVDTEVMLPADKLAAFKGMCQFPLATNVLCDTIFDEYVKIHTAQDSYFDVEMTDDSFKADFKDYLSEQLKIHEYFKGTGFEEFKTQPNAIYVIDLAIEQATDWPAPYRLTVDINNVHDIEIVKMPDGKRRIGFLIYRTSDTVYYVLDDIFYRRYTKNEGGEFNETPDIEVSHGLDYAPASFIIPDSLYNDFDNSPVARKSPLSREAANLSWLLFFKVAERLLETYAPFPIAAIPQDNCDFVDAHDNACHNGMLAGVTKTGRAYERKCPACNKASLVGPGTVYKRRMARTKDDVQLEEPVTFSTPEILSLDYVTKKIDYYEREIFANSVGDTDQTITKEAVNEDQVQANFEGRKSVLAKVKRQREQIINWTIDTIGRLRYGPYYIRCVTNLGDQWLLQTPDERINTYQLVKKAGMPSYLVGQAKESYVQTEYRNNPALQARADLLELLEPWPDRSIEECIASQLDFKFPEKFYLKLDFNKFVRKFELLNGDIVVWGALLSLDKKIEKLELILFEYGKIENNAVSKAFTERQSAETENIKQKGKGSFTGKQSKGA